ncbi:MAG: WbqC family protein [Bacilli bacterium]|nr:WbqC family protein [Bacilli bacterium]
MKVGIMQPYFFPYIGYWQLMNAVDKYVIYDDVNFIKGGWINRNRILINGEPKFFNVPLIGASPNKLINQVNVDNNPVLKSKNLRTLVNVYGKAPYFKDVYPIVESIITADYTNLAEYLANSFRLINNYLGIDTELIISSSLDKDCSLRAQDKVIAICKLLNANEYYNAIGGQELYSYDDFKKAGIELKFVKTDSIVYSQYSNDFVANLSIIDVLMFNSKEDVRKMLKQYTLIEENDEAVKLSKSLCEN